MSHFQNFNYRIDGDNQQNRLVFLHGLMGYGQNWRSIVREFEHKYQILSYDQRGHGKSFKPDSGYRPEDYAEDLHKILADLGWSKITLIGHSMGGRNAIEFASLYPEKLKALVVVDIGPDYNEDAITSIERIFAIAKEPFATREAAKELFLKNFSLSLANYLYANLIRKGEEWTWRFSKRGVLESLYQGRERNRWKEWQNIEIPSLVIRGEESEDLLPAVYEQMLASNSHAQGCIIKNAGHWVHSEQREAFCRALSHFLKSLDMG